MGFINWIKEVLDIENHESSEVPYGTVESAGTDAKECMRHESLPMTDEEKELVAVIASCIVGKDQPDIQLHIQKITRVE